MKRPLSSAIVLDARELFASRSFWFMMLAVSVLVGQTFLQAIALYAEASGAGGGPAALSQGLSPLEGVLVPTFGAYDLTATLLFPFVVIRIFSEDLHSGAQWLTLQAPMNFGWSIFSKGVVALTAWMIALLPGVTALWLWAHIGGHLYAPETLGLLLGHLLRGVFTIGIAAVAATISGSASSAAVVALAFTIGTWALDYIAAARGGVVAQIAQYTPWAALRTFERGEVRLSIVLILICVGVAGAALAATAAPSGRDRRSQYSRSLAVALVATAACVLSVRVSLGWDVSENRRNSFAIEDERALAAISQPLRVVIHLAAEDPRLTDLDHGVLAKLRRTMRDVRVTYSARSRTGLFEQADEHYGEVWYELGAKRAMTRSSIEEVVLETIYELAGARAPTHANVEPYPGYPLRAQSALAPWVFFLVWPVLISAMWVATRRRNGLRTQPGERS